MNINELVIKTDNELNAVEKEFLKNHQAIISAGVLIQNGFVELAKSLKNIRDNKLFLAIDCQSFEDYTEKVIGIKKTQAYKYIQVLENLGEEFSTRVEKVGITKLALISTLQEELKEKVIDKNDLEEISVSELKEQIRKLKDEKTKAQEETNKALEDKNKLNRKIDELKENLKIEKDKPVEKVVETVQDPELLNKVESLEYSLKLKERTIDNLREKVSYNEIKNSEELTKFKYIFDNIQVEIRQLKILLNQIPEEKQEGCKNALKAIGESLC